MPEEVIVACMAIKLSLNGHRAQRIFIRPHISVDLTHCSRREFGSTKERVITESYKLQSELLPQLCTEPL